MDYGILFTDRIFCLNKIYGHSFTYLLRRVFKSCVHAEYGKSVSVPAKTHIGAFINCNKLTSNPLPTDLSFLEVPQSSSWQVHLCLYVAFKFFSKVITFLSEVSSMSAKLLKICFPNNVIQNRQASHWVFQSKITYSSIKKNSQEITRTRPLGKWKSLLNIIFIFLSETRHIGVCFCFRCNCPTHAYTTTHILCSFFVRYHRIRQRVADWRRRWLAESMQIFKVISIIAFIHLKCKKVSVSVINLNNKARI